MTLKHMRDSKGFNSNKKAVNTSVTQTTKKSQLHSINQSNSFLDNINKMYNINGPSYQKEIQRESINGNNISLIDLVPEVSTKFSKMPDKQQNKSKKGQILLDVQPSELKSNASNLNNNNFSNKSLKKVFEQNNSKINIH